MSWWKELWSKPSSEGSPELPEALHGLHFGLSGWSEREPKSGARMWSGPDNSVLAVDATSERWDDLREGELRKRARALAESGGGGLIEVSTFACPTGKAVGFIYKRLPQLPAYLYTGMFIVPVQGGSVVWTVVAGECRMTGIRESIVTTELMNAGKLTVEAYERSWAQDPYDKSYRGEDRSVLRFLSDDVQFDSQFPDHPLTKVRQVLAELAKQAKAAPALAAAA
jgi:hypothetical protein